MGDSIVHSADHTGMAWFLQVPGRHWRGHPPPADSGLDIVLKMEGPGSVVREQR